MVDADLSPDVQATLKELELLRRVVCAYPVPAACGFPLYGEASNPLKCKPCQALLDVYRLGASSARARQQGLEEALRASLAFVMPELARGSAVKEWAQLMRRLERLNLLTNEARQHPAVRLALACADDLENG